jgi:hypothetical protein
VWVDAGFDRRLFVWVDARFERCPSVRVDAGFDRRLTERVCAENRPSHRPTATIAL